MCLGSPTTNKAFLFFDSVNPLGIYSFIIAAGISYAKLHINEYNFDNAKALQLKELYPAWESFFDKVIKINTIVNYEGNLYRCIAETSPVREGATPVDSIENYELIE